MKILSVLCLCSCLLVLTAVNVDSFSSSNLVRTSSQTPDAMPHPANIIPATPRSPGIQQNAYGAPVHFDAFQTIKLTDDDGIEFGISVQELNLHLVNQRTGNRLI